MGNSHLDKVIYSFDLVRYSVQKNELEDMLRKVLCSVYTFPNRCITKPKIHRPHLPFPLMIESSCVSKCTD